MSESNPSDNTSSSFHSENDVLLPNTMPEAEYMYGCTPTALGMLIGYYDLYGYRETDLSNLIEGVVTQKSRGTDGNAYDMDAFDTVLGKFIASKEYVSRFHSRDGVETTPTQELKCAFVNGGTELNTGVWNCLADYIGTGQYWRQNSNLSTILAYDTLENIAKNTSTITVTGDNQSRTIEYKYTTMLYGLDLLVKSRGYNLDYEITGTFATDNNGGKFTFEDYMAEIDAGRPVLISITDHAMVGYGYNADTREIIFDDCYNADQRMVWGEGYYYAGEDRTLQSITVIGFKTSASAQTRDLKLTSCEGHSETIVLANAKATSESTPFFCADDKLYLNFAVGNDGNSASGAFVVAIYLNGVKVHELSVSDLGANAVREFRDIELGTVELGNNSVKIIVDDGNLIQETTGTNNVLEKGFLVLTQDTLIISSGSSTIATGKDLSRAFITSGGKVIVSGGTATEDIVGYCNYYNAGLHVLDGGIAERTTVYSGGTINVSSGGTANEATIYSGGEMYVHSGATANAATVNASGYLCILSGGVANSATINAGAVGIWSGGRTNSAILNASGGELDIFSGGTANYTILNAFGASLRVYNPGGIANSTTIHAGELDVWSGGIANNTVVDSSGWFAVFSGGTANNAIVDSGGRLYVYSSGTATAVKENGGYVLIYNGANISFLPNAFSGLVLSNGTATVHSGTTAVNAVVNSSGCLWVYSGGRAENLVTTDSGWTHVPGGVISNASVGSQAFFLLYSSGSANDLDVMSGGRAFLYDCTIGKTTVERGGTLIVSGKVTLTDDLYLAGNMNVETTCGGSGFVNAKKHAIALDLTECLSDNAFFISDLSQLSNFSLSVKMCETQESGIYRLAKKASSFTGSITVSLENGVSTSLSVGKTCTIGNLHCTLTTSNYNGHLFLEVVNSGTQKTPETSEYVPGTWSTDWAQASKYAKEHDMMIFAFYGDRTWCTYSDYMTRYLLNTEDFKELSKSVVLLYNTPVPDQYYSGSPHGYLLDANGNCLAQRSGFGRSYHDSWMAWLKIMLGKMSGVYFYDESQTFTALGNVTSGKTISSATSLFVCQNGTANSMTVKSGAQIVVFSGVADSMKVAGGSVDVFSGGTMNNTTVQKNGYVGILEAGLLNDTTVQGQVQVFNGGTGNNTILNSSGFFIVHSGGIANNTTVNNSCIMCLGRTMEVGQYVIYGGTANGTIINSGGTMSVSRGGIANDTTVNNSGIIYLGRTTNIGGYVYGGSGTANGTKINSGGTMSVSRGGIANDTTVNAGYLFVYSGGTVNGTVINPGGKMTIASGGKLTGQMTFEADATISAYFGARIDFDLTRTDAGIAALVNNLSILKGSPVYTLTTKGNQAPGIYRLAEGASGFNGTISVVNTSGDNLGTLSVGPTVSIKNADYTLNLDEGLLSVTIGEPGPDLVAPTIGNIQASITAPTNHAVTVTAVFADDIELKSSLYRIGEAGEWKDYGNGVPVDDNATVYFKAIDAAGNESEVASYTVANIDKIPPGKPVLSADITEPTKRRVLVSAEFSADTVLKEYSLDSLSWLVCTGAVKITENGTVYFRGTDAAGNVSEAASYEVTNIDKTLADDGPDDGWNDYLYDKKTGLNPKMDDFSSAVLADGFSGSILLDEADSVNVDGRHNFVGRYEDEYIDVADYAKIVLENAARLVFTIDSTDAVKFVVCKLNETTGKSGKVSYSVKELQTTSFTLKKGADSVAGDTKELLVESGEYYLSVQSTNYKKGGAAFYNVALNADASDFFIKGDNSDDWNDVKSAGAGGAVGDEDAITDGTTEVFSGWVGFGDAVDYKSFRVGSSVKLSFALGASDKTKFTIWKLNSKTDKKGVTTYSLKSLQSTSLAKDRKSGTYAASTKMLLLDEGTYYFSVESTNAKKGGNADYTVDLNSDASVFFVNGDDGANNWVYDKKTKTLNSDECFVTTNITSSTGEILLDKKAVDTEWNNFVGYGDAADYAKITLSSAANLSFTLTAADAAKFVICKLVEGTGRKSGTFTLKSLQSTKLKKSKAASIYTADTKALALDEGEYFISMESTNSKKGGAAYYKVELNTANCARLPTAVLAAHDADALAMPEASAMDALADSNLNLMDAMSFGQYDTDALADASAFSLADLDNKTRWQSLTLA